MATPIGILIWGGNVTRMVNLTKSEKWDSCPKVGASIQLLAQKKAAR